MITAAIFALTFFIIYMSRTIFVGNVQFGGPDYIKVPYTIFLVFHIILATVGGLMGIGSLTLAFMQKFNIHRVFSRFTAVIWFLTAITGIVVYVMLFILWPGPMDTSLLKAIMG
jgi:putative membrane protein